MKKFINSSKKMKKFTDPTTHHFSPQNKTINDDTNLEKLSQNNEYPNEKIH